MKVAVPLPDKVMDLIARVGRPTSAREIYSQISSGRIPLEEIQAALDDLERRRRIRLCQGRTEVRRGGTIFVTLFPAYEARRKGGGS